MAFLKNMYCIVVEEYIGIFLTIVPIGFRHLTNIYRTRGDMKCNPIFGCRKLHLCCSMKVFEKCMPNRNSAENIFGWIFSSQAHLNGKRFIKLIEIFNKGICINFQQGEF